MPWLYLKGISTGDFQEALQALLGSEAKGLSASTISRCKKIWEEVHETWNSRSLENKRYVYIWADGVYFNIRSDHAKQCILVIIGVTEQVELGGVSMGVKIARFRLCHSRKPFCIAYTRETLEMVLDAHIRAFEFFGGVCYRGIYDNLKTVVNKVLLCRDRVYNRRFQNLASHYLLLAQECRNHAATAKHPERKDQTVCGKPLWLGVGGRCLRPGYR